MATGFITRASTSYRRRILVFGSYWLSRRADEIGNERRQRDRLNGLKKSRRLSCVTAPSGLFQLRRRPSLYAVYRSRREGVATQDLSEVPGKHQTAAESH